MSLQPHRSPRAPRFSIPITILYRNPGDTAWLEGRTENISRSGVLFRADSDFELDTPVEMMMDIPSWIATPAAGTTICRGRIVRAVPPTPLGDRRAFAARILEYELARPSDPRRI